MKKTVLIIHGGAGPDSPFIRENIENYKKGLGEALEAGYAILKKEGKATDAVEAAINALENNPFFNAGRGSSINAKGEVEMCASIMNGENLNSGAVAIVKNVKNPVSLAKAVMQTTDYIYLGGEGALDFAKQVKVELEPDAYFITEQKFDEYLEKRKEAYESGRDVALEEINSRMHGTVGAVALDAAGNIAAATSTGGTAFCKEGRIGDSSMIGVGTYADNKTCAISTTGDGEYLIRGVIAHSVSSFMKYKNKSLKEACKEIVHNENKDVKGDIGLIALDAEGNMAVEFNSEHMHRAWKLGDEKPVIKIYRE